MKRQSPPIIALLLLLGPWSHWALAQSIPTAIPYTGLVTVDGVRFNGNGQFKFAIINPAGQALWSNAAPMGTGEPINAVTIAVSNGLYGVELGDTDRANMMAIPSTVFDTPVTSLRVWFSDGVNGFQLLSPDRQLVSVPYAYQAEKAREVSGTGTVVKSIAPSGGTALTDDIVLDGAGNIDIQQSGNTITIVGTTGTAAALDLACATPCVSPAEISGTLTDAHIPDLNTLSGTLTALQLPNIGTLSGTVTDTQVPDLGTLSGVLTDMQIPSGIARNTDVAASISSAINLHATADGAHNFSSISGTLTDLQIPDLNTLSGTLTAAQLPAIGTLSGTVTDLQIPDLGTLSGTLTDLQIPDLGTLSGILIDAQIPDLNTLSGTLTAAQLPAIGTLSGTLADAQIPASVALETEVPILAGPTVNSAITTHVATPNVHPLGAYTEGTLDEALIDPDVARDSELPTWATLAGVPADFADGVDNVGSLAETDPQVGALSDNRVPKWSATALVDGQIYDNGTFVGIGTTTQTPDPAALLEVAGTVRVASLAASYGRVVIPNQSAPAGMTTTLNAPCPGNTNVLSGGYELDTLPLSVTVLGSWPPNGNSWSVKIENSSLADLAVNIFAVCAAIQ